MKALAIIKNFTVNHTEQFNMNLISKDRLERAEIFTDKLEKERFLAAEQLASQFTSISFSIPTPYFSGGVGEKPYLREYPNISVSRSYAGDCLAIAAEQPYKIGIDCEEIKDFDSNIMKYFFTNKEQKYIETSKSSNTAFTVLWTRKESYIKCIGRGIDYPINTLDVTPTKYIENINCEGPVFIENDKINKCFVNSYILGKLVISVCSECNDAFPAINQIDKEQSYEQNNTRFF